MKERVKVEDNVFQWLVTQPQLIYTVPMTPHSWLLGRSFVRVESEEEIL